MRNWERSKRLSSRICPEFTEPLESSTLPTSTKPEEPTEVAEIEEPEESNEFTIEVNTLGRVEEPITEDVPVVKEEPVAEDIPAVNVVKEPAEEEHHY